MAESDSILQLGIEAARDGNKEEARNLFRLLTRQEPQNSQAWLWLAGVAESREERQTALEHVVELDPENEMAIKGLEALGASPPRREVDEPPTIVPPPPVEEPVRSQDPYDDPFAELDSLSDTFNESPDAVRSTDASATDAPFDSQRQRSGPHDFDDDRGRSAPPLYQDSNYEDETEPARGVSPLLLGLVILAFIILLAVIVWPNQDESDVAGVPTAPVTGGLVDPTANAVGEQAPGTETDVTGEPGVVGEPEEVPGGEGTPPEGGEGTPPEGGEGTPPEGGEGTPPEGGEGTPPEGGEGTPPEGGEAPLDEGTPPDAGGPPPQDTSPPIDVANANPEIVAPGTALESNGWEYNFSQPNYATAIVGGLGNVQPQGRLVVVLVLMNNNTGQVQSVPGDFFVLKDAQGRVYNPMPQASTAYVNTYGRGVVADVSQEDAVPADNLLRSVPIVFDVEPDATDLTFFARSNPGQGWQVLGSI